MSGQRGKRTRLAGIELFSLSVNHSAPSGPAVICLGTAMPGDFDVRRPGRPGKIGGDHGRASLPRAAARQASGTRAPPPPRQPPQPGQTCATHATERPSHLSRATSGTKAALLRRSGTIDGWHQNGTFPAAQGARPARCCSCSPFLVLTGRWACGPVTGRRPTRRSSGRLGRRDRSLGICSATPQVA